MKKIAISFIGTGKYINLFENYYNSFNNLFAPGHYKKFFVMTDQDFITQHDNVEVI
jgi:hypothetical protein